MHSAEKKRTEKKQIITCQRNLSCFFPDKESTYPTLCVYVLILALTKNFAEVGSHAMGHQKSICRLAKTLCN